MTAAETTRRSEMQSSQIPATTIAPRDAAVSSERAGWPDGLTPWGQSDTRMARSGLALRRLRYFHRLLADGFTASRSDDLPSGMLRSERIALAIDRPELDVVALWATRRDDGTAAIPFIEYLLGQFIGSLEMFLADLADPGAAAEVAALSTALDLTLKEANRRGEQALWLPQPGDSFLPEALLERLCGREGLLERTVRCCEALLAAAVPMSLSRTGS